MYRNDLIRGRMAELGLRVEDVAARTHLSRPTVSAIRQGDVNIYLVSLAKVACSLGLPMADLFRSRSAVSTAESGRAA